MKRPTNPGNRALHAVLIATIAALTIGVGSAVADSIDDSNEDARSELSVFAKSWIGKMRHNQDEQRKHPSVRPGATQNVTSYRGIADDYNVELRPTGQPNAPFIGILRYTEQVYTCRDAASGNCSVASSVPVTEIFRYQAGRWVY